MPEILYFEGIYAVEKVTEGVFYIEDAGLSYNCIKVKALELIPRFVFNHTEHRTDRLGNYVISDEFATMKHHLKPKQFEIRYLMGKQKVGVLPDGEAPWLCEECEAENCGIRVFIPEDYVMTRTATDYDQDGPCDEVQVKETIRGYRCLPRYWLRKKPLKAKESS